MKLSAISYLLHIILQTYGYVDIDDGGDEYRVIYDATNPKFLEAPEGGKDGKTSCETLYQAMEKVLEITRSVEECEITCGGQWFRCSHSGLAPDEEIIDSYVTPFAESITEGYEQQSVEQSLAEAMAFMRHGDQGLDWYDLWNEGSFKEAAQHWPEAPLSANYFADSLMFCREE